MRLQAMDRRFFLKLVSASGLTLSAGGVALLEPRKTYFLPPKGGWDNDSIIKLVNVGSELWIFGEQSIEVGTTLDRKFHFTNFMVLSE